MSKRWKTFFAIGTLAVSIALILWLTLFSRLGSDSRHFYPPFWSYRAILNGDSRALLENIGNVVLFIPIGVAIALFLGCSVKQTLVIGFTLSLVIESCQWFFWLGSYEIDDLIHNTIGAGIGAVLIQKTAIGASLQRQVREKTKSLRVLIYLVIILVAMPLGYQGIKYQEMRWLASLNNKDGIENLLVLSADPQYIGQTDVNVIYNSDGSILIEGGSNCRAWIQISKFTLAPGLYYMEGLSGLPKNTVGLELATFDYDQDKYVMVGHEVGAIDRLDFELQEKSKMEVLISLYPGWEGCVAARPAIFREDK